MSRKIIETVNGVGCSVKVYKDSEWGEYVCRLYDFGKLYEPADYFTNDKADAIGTARDMVKRCDASQGIRKNSRYAAHKRKTARGITAAASRRKRAQNILSASEHRALFDEYASLADQPYKGHRIVFDGLNNGYDVFQLQNGKFEKMVRLETVQEAKNWIDGIDLNEVRRNPRAQAAHNPPSKYYYVQAMAKGKWHTVCTFVAEYPDSMARAFEYARALNKQKKCRVRVIES